jgi:hypothetical protein
VNFVQDTIERKQKEIEKNEIKNKELKESEKIPIILNSSKSFNSGIVIKENDKKEDIELDILNKKSSKMLIVKESSIKSHKNFEMKDINENLFSNLPKIKKEENDEISSKLPLVESDEELDKGDDW